MKSSNHREDVARRISELEAEVSHLQQQLDVLRAGALQPASEHESDSWECSRINWRSLLERSPVCTKVLDRDCNLVYMSEAGVAGLGIEDAAEYYGKPYPLEFFPDEFKHTMDRCLDRVCSTGEASEHEGVLCDVYGQPYWYRATLLPQCDETGQVEYIVVVSINITDYHQAEEKLRFANAQLTQKTKRTQELARRAEKSNLAKREFLANMSHEIRTPMTAILGYAESLADTASTPEQANAVSIIRQNGSHLIEIINDMLDLSSIEAGKIRIDRAHHCPRKIVSEVVKLVEPRAIEKGLDINVEYVDAVPTSIQTDATRLRQILINLLGNAIKFTDSGAIDLVVRFTPDSRHPRMQFDVHDTGIGMTAEQTAKLFEPFTQADTSTTRRFGGTGLGLAISKRFAQLLDGDIAVVKTKPGVGTLVRATIATGAATGSQLIGGPRATVDQLHHVDGTLASQPLAGCKIMVVDDSIDMRRLFSMILQQAGADVSFAEDGAEGLEAALDIYARGEQFDCILMDMQMPVMSGYEATARLRRAGYSGPVIAVTAHCMDGDEERCIRAGCNSYTTKPIEKTELIKLVAAQSDRSSKAA